MRAATLALPVARATCGGDAAWMQDARVVDSGVGVHFPSAGDTAYAGYATIDVTAP